MPSGSDTFCRFGMKNSSKKLVSSESGMSAKLKIAHLTILEVDILGKLKVKKIKSISHLELLANLRSNLRNNTCQMPAVDQTSSQCQQPK